MGSLSEYRRSAGAVHSIGWHIVWFPKYRNRVLVGQVADRLRELLLAKAAERGWSVEALEFRKYIGEKATRPIRGQS